MSRQVRHSALALEAEPGRRRYLFPDFADNGLIDLDLVFQGVECVLQLLDELVGQVWPSRRKARGLQIGDRTDPVSPRLHGNRAGIPPGRLGLFELRLLLPEPVPVRDPSRNELRELIGWHDADSVEVEVAAVPARGLRMKDVGSLHAKLPLKYMMRSPTHRGRLFRAPV